MTETKQKIDKERELEKEVDRVIAEATKEGWHAKVKHPKSHSYPTVISYIVLGALLLIILGELFGVRDYIKAANFQPTEEMSAIIDKLQLTGKGERIFRATEPTLEDSQTFNKNCESHNQEVYVLGCYDANNDKLHLYNVQMEELTGIVESTAAHEMLHAVWDRLAVWERNGLKEELLNAYQSLSDNSDIRASMELYQDNEFYDELHSRLGTQVANLPESLERHYANYFSDQDAIVALFNSYNDTYKALEDKLRTMKSQIDALGTEIDAETIHYNEWSRDLDNRIISFNNNVDRLSNSEYAAQHTALANEIKEIDDYYDMLSEKINHYNELVEEYNKSALHHQEVLNSMNSNAERPNPELKN